MKKLILSGLVLAAAALSAKTVALWPLNWDASTGRVDGRCAISAANDLSTDAALDYQQIAGPEWTLPPNPDGTGTYLFAPGNTSAAHSSGTASAVNYAYSGTAGQHVRSDRDFTLEGFVRFPQLPASGGLFFVMDADGMHSQGNQRWFLTLRNNSGATGVTWQLFSSAYNTGDKVLCTLSSAEIANLTTGWHHLALTHASRNADGKAVWSFYQDGVLKGALTNAAFTGTVNTWNGLFLGGRNNRGNVFTGALKYCRLSDAVLEPADFLNRASADFTPVTRGFWRLRGSADGTVDGAPSAGTAYFGSAFHRFGFTTPSGDGTYSDSLLQASDDCAFTGDPPNTTVHLPAGNRGSLASTLPAVRSTFRVNGPARDLALTNDFSVEGWVRLEWRQPTGWLEYLHLFGTRTGGVGRPGWIFQLQWISGRLVPTVHVQDGSGVLFSPGPQLGDVTDRIGRWTHLALVYDCDGGANGRGLWSCYVDGALAGSAENPRAPVDGGFDPQDPEYRFKFSALSAAGNAFPGKVDCWRVTKAALRPTQLLCASTDCEAVPEADVVAFWPLNAQRGIGVDGTDLSGAYTFHKPLPDNQLPVGCAGAPDVPGVSEPENGSVGFRVTNGGSRSYLCCNHDQVLETLRSANGCTLEVYLRRTTSSDNTEFITFVYENQANLWANAVQNFQYRSTGFWIYVYGVTNGDQQFKDADGQPVLLPTGGWTHVALVSRKTDAGVWAFDLYLDGVKRATTTGISGTWGRTPHRLYLGGRPTTDNSFRGQMSCLRITEGVLAPEQMLCASAADRRTAAYWPLDAADGTLDLLGRVPWGGCAWNMRQIGTATAVSAGARRSVPRPDDSPDFVGSAKANAGAVALSGTSALAAARVGGQADVLAAFTVEGWVKGTGPHAGLQKIAGTHDAATSMQTGWQLLYDATGATPVLRLRAQGWVQYGVLADGVLLADASCLDDGWHHLALRYDPVRGAGTWSLLLDGVGTGLTVENTWPANFARSTATFHLGAVTSGTAFSGAYDMWRIKGGVLGKEEILFAQPAGLTVLVR